MVAPIVNHSSRIITQLKTGQVYMVFDIRECTRSNLGVSTSYIIIVCSFSYQNLQYCFRLSRGSSGSSWGHRHCSHEPRHEVAFPSDCLPSLSLPTPAGSHGGCGCGDGGGGGGDWRSCPSFWDFGGWRTRIPTSPLSAFLPTIGARSRRGGDFLRWARLLLQACPGGGGRSLGGRS